MVVDDGDWNSFSGVKMVVVVCRKNCDKHDVRGGSVIGGGNGDDSCANEKTQTFF